jgi:hypothetical protein
LNSICPARGVGAAQLRTDALSACIRDGYEAILAACRKTWNGLMDDTEAIMRIGRTTQRSVPEAVGMECCDH